MEDSQTMSRTHTTTLMTRWTRLLLPAFVLAAGCSVAPAADGKKLVVQAGDKDRAMVPMCVELPEGLTKPKMVDADTGKTVPCQVEEGHLWWILDELPAGKTKTYTVSSGGTSKPVVSVTKEHRALQVDIAGKPFTTFVCDPDQIRPYCYPVFGPGQKRMTRGYPMEDISGERKDHHHHRSFYVAHGEFQNGKYNFWHEPKDKAKQDRQVIVDIPKAGGGPVFGFIHALIDWTGHDGVKVVHERRTLRFYNVDGEARIIDLNVVFDARYGDVHFGDTKEGGICALRVAPEIRENGRYGGQLTNSNGQKGEGRAWGKKAKWVDYSRTKGEQYGIAVFDTPGNLRYPTTWHIRGYGLFTANPFGLSYFAKGSGKKGDYTLKNGDELAFTYRVYIHRGDCEGGKVGARYDDYVNPPSASWK